jgi:hypothetical protein
MVCWIKGSTSDTGPNSGQSPIEGHTTVPNPISPSRSSRYGSMGACNSRPGLPRILGFHSSCYILVHTGLPRDRRLLFLPHEPAHTLAPRKYQLGSSCPDWSADYMKGTFNLTSYKALYSPRFRKIATPGGLSGKRSCKFLHSSTRPLAAGAR